MDIETAGRHLNRGPRRPQLNRSRSGADDVGTRDQVESTQSSEKTDARDNGSRRKTQNTRSNVERTEREPATIRRKDSQHHRPAPHTAEKELVLLRRRCEELTTQLKSRTDEMNAVQSFLTTVDDISEAEVIGMVTTLNAHIFQVSARLADSLQYHARSTLPSQAESQASGWLIGEGLTEALVRGDHSNDPTLLQIAFQCCATQLVAWIAGRWDFSVERERHRVIEHTYRLIRKQDTQAIAAGWRSLTMRHLLSRRDKEDVHRTMADTFFHAFSDVARIAGVGGADQELYDMIVRRGALGVKEIVKGSLEIGSVIKVKMLSSDLVVIAAEIGEEFEEDEMEDDYGEHVAGDPAADDGMLKILGTTQIGLQRAEKLDGIISVTTLVKQKIVLDNIVGDESTTKSLSD
ncbi:hypothetical protein C8Q75DRAFT_836736 [Abortiporus biennis]|nr:hypothetical protein C8Q75DRAFT_836736 [Abortiporus biennis]